jgi:hypothetical protein
MRFQSEGGVEGGKRILGSGKGGESGNHVSDCIDSVGISVHTQSIGVNPLAVEFAVALGEGEVNLRGVNSAGKPRSAARMTGWL